MCNCSLGSLHTLRAASTTLLLLASQARDCAVTRESRSAWRRVLGHNATLRNPRDLAACMVQVTRHTACPLHLPA